MSSKFEKAVAADRLEPGLLPDVRHPFATIEFYGEDRGRLLLRSNIDPEDLVDLLLDLAEELENGLIDVDPPAAGVVLQ